MKIHVKTFDQLTVDELYKILRLRAEVFIVEQDCVYQDIDDKDQKALHVIGMRGDRLVAYTRCFKPGDYFEEASIGRVVVKNTERNHKFGYDIMKASISSIKALYNVTTIKLSAQTYLKKFYNNLGFKEVGDGYLEDGIPHIAMVRK